MEPNASASTSADGATAAQSQTVMPALGAAETGAAAADQSLTPTQNVIRKVRSLDSVIPLGDVVMALTSLESRQSAAAPIQEQDTLRRPRYRCDCFDTSSQYAWTSHRICERCSILNELLKLAAKNPSSAAVAALVASTRTETACVSALQSSCGETPTLPREMLKMVMDLLFAGLKTSSGYNLALCQLMHVDSSLRSQVVRAFKPPSFVDSYVQSHRDAEVICASWDFVSYMFQAISYHCQDFSIKRHGGHEPVVPNSDVRLGAANEFNYDFMEWTITIATRPDPRSEFVDQLTVVKEVHVQEGHLQIRDACEALRDALKTRTIHDCASVAGVHRLLQLGSYSSFKPSKMRYGLTLGITDETYFENMAYASRTWHFVNV